MTDVEILRLHYAETLRHWRRRCLANRDKIKQMAGYDDRFCRMWKFYLAGCEIAFRYMNQMVFQIQIARRQDAVPLTRGDDSTYYYSTIRPILQASYRIEDLARIDIIVGQNLRVVAPANGSLVIG